MANATYRIKIVRGDFHLEVDGDKKFVLEMISRFDKLPTNLADNSQIAHRAGKERAPESRTLTSAKGISPGEFVRQFQFKKHTDLVLAFGYYLEKSSGLTSFSAADINNCYYEAKMESSNTSQMIVQNIKRGFMMQAKNKGQEGGRKLFTLTQTGEDHLQKKSASSKGE